MAARAQMRKLQELALGGGEEEASGEVRKPSSRGRQLLYWEALKSKKQAYVGISQYFVERGVLGQLHSDNAREMTTKSEWRKTLRDEGGIKATTTEPYSPFQNNAEREIRHLQALGPQATSKGWRTPTFLG